VKQGFSADDLDTLLADLDDPQAVLIAALLDVRSGPLAILDGGGGVSPLLAAGSFCVTP
jgi:hypothetical protein